ncbi:DegT/DnrJ/EryC1/StrS family aminotransferase [Halalkalicoccus subterraneus]|uniref:DegT/DnrJ/EryC1/StrS family aminotransferase n=1 Tax=Halalkalicoccus subterraneus TaxID=2675002 RepID=UPI000EFBB5F1|nr:DegT/DnrJ/EryC1/StrS family aminotransferase [Halalkalicoccus subterraneus]
MSRASTLAIDGGDPAVTIDDPERWERPIEAEREIVTDLLESGVISGSGSGFPLEFEEKFREYSGAEYCLTVDHGSTAIESAFYAVGVGPGDEVITPTVGYIGAYAGALHLGARPVFCEIDPETLLPDPTDIERRITDRTAAIAITHWNGRVCDMDAILDISDRYDIPVVEDAAHAHASEWKDEHVGSVGDIACFSLQGVSPHGKPIAAGEGGIVTTNVREYYERQLSYCHLHRSGVNDELTLEPYDGLDWEVLGLKYRAHPLALGIATVGLENLDYRVERRLRYRDRLFEHLDELPGIRPVWPYEESETDGLYGGLKVVLEPDELGRSPETVVDALAAEGAPVRGPGFSYMEHRRRIFREGYDLWGRGRSPIDGEFCGLPAYEGYQEGDFPISEALDERVVTVASYIEPEEEFVDQVARAFEKVAR